MQKSGFSRRVWLVVCLAAFLAAPAAVMADDVLESINEAVNFYKEGNHSEAISSLNYASQLIAQKKAGALEAFLPAAQTGWARENVESQAVSSSMFGGGIGASANYTRASTSEEDYDTPSVLVKIAADSPVLQGMMAMMTNPMFMGSDGGKLERIKGQQAVVKYDPQNKSGDINIAVAQRFLVTVEGSNVSKEDLVAYASAIDYRKLATLP